MKRKRMPISRVKRVKIAQRKKPLSKKEYKRQLKIARRIDFFRNFLIVIAVIIGLLAAGFVAGNMYLKKESGMNLFEMADDAKQIVADSRPEDFRLAESSYVYDSDGNQIAELASDTDATYLKYDQIPEDVINAFVSIEDRTYWENEGYDVKGIIRAVVDYARSHGKVAEGASTITQQLARTQYLTRDKSIIRKIREIFIAKELAEKYSKEQIMEFYCNTCCFANGIYGVQDASLTYFSVPVDELDVSQIAYICAIPNYPEYYNPYKDSANAIPRRNKILKDMLECGYIAQGAYEEAVAEDITVTPKAEKTEYYDYETTYAVNCAVRYLMKVDGFGFEYEFEDSDSYDTYMEAYNEAYEDARYKLYTGGYKVYTTIDEDAQENLQDVLNEGLSFNDNTKDDGVYELQGAMTVIDNETGKVVAIIGGRKQEELDSTYSLNRAFQSYRQPGSTFKPLVVYTPAFEEGYTQYSILRNINVTKAKKASSSEISNMYGDGMTLRRAVINSVNGCAYWLFNEIGIDTGISHVHDMHFTKILPSDHVKSAALGALTYGATTVEMANAYSTIENHGQFTETDCISQIVDHDGNNIYSSPDTTRVYDQEAADNMTDVMMGVVTTGTASSMNWYSHSDTDAAGKTGTTNESKDGWFCGFTPYYTIAVWVGYDQPKELSNLYGGTYPARIWREAMLYMIDGKETASFDIEKISRHYSVYQDYGYTRDTEETRQEETTDEEVTEEDTEETTETTEETTETTGETTDTTEAPAEEAPADDGGGEE